MKLHILCLVIFLVNSSKLSSLSSPLVNTTSGLLKGTTTAKSHAFYAVPFAQPPIAELRFKSPIPISHQGPLDVSQYKLIQCVQPIAVGNMTEDCLVLNVYVPSGIDLTSSIAPSERLPVMLWIHGGAFILGSGTISIYDSNELCNVTNTIIVTVNYRLGIFGFLVISDETQTYGNQGFKDQQLAMMWVRDNIHNFGGNKNRVTIFGESSGAQSVLLHLVSPISAPLYQQAILQSNIVTMPHFTIADANELTQLLTKEFNCSGPNQFQCLQSKDTTINLDAISVASAFAIGRKDFIEALEPIRPYIDGVEFTDQPLKMMQNGIWNRNPIIAGTNSDEANFVYNFYGNTTVSKNSFQTIVNEYFGAEKGQLITAEYFKFASNEPGFDYINILGDLMGDSLYVCPNRALARLAHETSSTSSFLYTYNYPLDLTPHGAELAYVFRTVVNATKNDTIVMNIFSDYWKNFAYRGIPDSSNFAKWPVYDSTDQIMRITVPNSNVVHNFKKEVCDFWDSIGLYINMTSVDMTTGGVFQPEMTTAGAVQHYLTSFYCVFALATWFLLAV